MYSCFLFTDTAPSDISTLSLHDALPILQRITDIQLHSKIADEAEEGGDISYIYIFGAIAAFMLIIACINYMNLATARSRSEEHTSELQSRLHLVCRLLLEKKKR